MIPRTQHDVQAQDHPPGPSIPDPAPSPRAWLEHFPPERRSAIANWFHYSVRSGVSVPAQVLVAVEATVRRRLQEHPHDETFPLVLAKLREERSGALAYATSVIAYEQLPHEARQRAKAERTFAHLKEVMRGKDVTAAQTAYLDALGYHGPAPRDRAEASALIDQLKQGGTR